LSLPDSRMDDRPGRQEQNRWVARAVALPEDPDPAALGVADFIRISGAGLLAPGDADFSGGHRRRSSHFRWRCPRRSVGTATRTYGRASNTLLNGVSATRRNRVKPAAVTTSRIRASPACAPSASPTSCESEAGVHSRVENP